MMLKLENENINLHCFSIGWQNEIISLLWMINSVNMFGIISDTKYVMML